MRKLSMALLALGLVGLLSGCSNAQQPEHQAYVISMCAEHVDDKKLRIGITLPVSTSSASSDQGGGSGSDGDYDHLYATADSFFAAIDVLQSVTPYPLNLSQMTSMIISRELAESDDFGAFLEDMMMTNHLYSNTQLIISQGSAKKFMENEKPELGKMLSLELSTSYEHYTLQGYVPSSKLSDVYYTCASIYGDPLCILAATVEDGSDGGNKGGQAGGGSSGQGGSATEAAASTDTTFSDVLPEDIPVEKSGKNRYLGAALIKDFRMVGVLNGAQTHWIEVLNGKLPIFSMVVDGDPMRVKVHGRSKVRVDASGEAPKISIGLTIELVPMREMPDPNHVIELVTGEINDMLDAIRALGVDPLGFSEIAASKFLTSDDFQRYSWSDRFKQAQFDVQVKITGSYTL